MKVLQQVKTMFWIKETKLGINRNHNASTSRSLLVQPSLSSLLRVWSNLMFNHKLSPLLLGLITLSLRMPQALPSLLNLSQAKLPSKFPSIHTTVQIPSRCLLIALLNSHSLLRQVFLLATLTRLIKIDGSPFPTSVAWSTATSSLLLMDTVSMDRKSVVTLRRDCLSTPKLRWGTCSPSIVNTFRRSRLMNSWTPMKSVLLLTTHSSTAMKSYSMAT